MNNITVGNPRRGDISTSYSPGNRVTYQGKTLELQEVMIGGKMIQAFVEVKE